jgi:hypothetical protein
MSLSGSVRSTRALLVCLERDVQIWTADDLDITIVVQDLEVVHSTALIQGDLVVTGMAVDFGILERPILVFDP